jgi:serine/threonine-protein kinase
VPRDSNSDARARVGAVLNAKWTLERLLGVGGMAAVYAGRHRNGARAAIKVLHRELARNKEVRERFRREGYAANKVGHPNVVKVLDDDVVADGPDAGTPYLVMEMLEGESLQDRLERGPPVGEREFLAIAYEVLGVLQAAQEAGVVHRDLKPENLFFAREDGQAGNVRIKILDFGLARLLSGQSLTTHGLALGTPSFMSPEQAAGRLSDIDSRTDLFALAATGFRLRTGRRIHEGDNPVELVTKMARLPAPRIRTVAPDVSPPFARVIDRALEFKREDRYESASAMREDVGRAIAELDASVSDAPSRRPAPPLPPRIPAPDRPTGNREPTIELSERDIVRPPPFGMDESIRIPKNTPALPWIVLLVVVGAGFALWRDLAHGSRLLQSVHALFAPGEPTAEAPPAFDGSAQAVVEAATPPPAASSTRSPVPGAAASVPRRSAPARLGPGSVPNLRPKP